MEEIIQWGLLVIQNIQQVQSPFLNVFFRSITFLGDEVFYLIFFPALLWCIDFKLGIRVGVLFLLSVYFNTLLKIIFQQPRPFYLLSTIELSYAEGFGFPSGHAQSSILVWLSLAYQMGKRIMWFFAFFLSFLIGFSRIYLGVHFPHDVVGGWLVGGLIFYLYHFSIRSRVEGAKKIRISFKTQLLFISLLPVIILIFPVNNDIISVIAALTGVGWGLVINSQFIHFQGNLGTFWQRAVRLLVGVLGIVCLYYGLRLLFPQSGHFAYKFFRFIRYALLGMWIGAGAPWMFLKLQLFGGRETSAK